MSPFVAGIAGVLLGAVAGWFLGNGMGRSGQSDALARQQALDDERKRLADALSAAEHALEAQQEAAAADTQQLAKTRETLDAAAQENRRLIRRIDDLEAALASGSANEKPSAALEMQLVMAMRERDAAQKQLLELEAKNAIQRSLPPPGEPDPIGFDELPELPDLSEEAPTEELVDEIPEAPVPSFSSDPDDDRTAADFTIIKGVGPTTHTRLIELGFRQLTELADLSDEALADLERDIGSRRPSRDDWRGQAQALVSSGQEPLEE